MRLAVFANEMIKPLSFDETSLKMLKNMKYFSWFRIVSMQSKEMHSPVFVPVKKVVLGLDKKMSVHKMP